MLNPSARRLSPPRPSWGRASHEGLEKISEAVLDAFKDKLPEILEGEIGQSFEAVEGGLVMALRDVSQRDEPPSDVVIARIGAGRGAPRPRREPVSDPLPLVPEDGRGPAASARSGGARRPAAATRVGDEASASQPRVLARARRRIAGVSFAELWPEGEQEMVRDVEEAICRGRYWRAIELLRDAGLRASSPAPLASSAPTRPRATPPWCPCSSASMAAATSPSAASCAEARGDGLITAREALSAFAFAIECRIAQHPLVPLQVRQYWPDFYAASRRFRGGRSMRTARACWGRVRACVGPRVRLIPPRVSQTFIVRRNDAVALRLQPVRRRHAGRAAHGDVHHQRGRQQDREHARSTVREERQRHADDGSTPEVIPMLMMACQKIIAVPPTASTAPKRSLASDATRMAHTVRNPYRQMSTTLPAKPHSSAKTGKGKSLD